MRIKGLEVKNPEEIQTTIYQCAYCTKKFLNKNSYYNHIAKKYCLNYYIDFEEKTQKYNQNKITKKEYYLWCYENGYVDFLNLNGATKEELGKELFEKIENLYDDYY